MAAWRGCGRHKFKQATHCAPVLAAMQHCAPPAPRDIADGGGHGMLRDGIARQAEPRALDHSWRIARLPPRITTSSQGLKRACAAPNCRQ